VLAGQPAGRRSKDENETMNQDPDWIYLDNAATTFPKPRQMLDQMVAHYASCGVSPGRGGYDLALQAEDIVDQARRKLARFFGAPDPNRVVFAYNATDALNSAIQGLLGPGDHVIASRLDHNSVLRPLNHMVQSAGIQVDHVGFDGRGLIDPQDIAALIRPQTRLVILCHASNVLGTIQPVHEIGQVCAQHGILFVLDAAQSAGQVPIDMISIGAAAIAFTGHKSLYGPTGIGGLVIHPDVEIRSTRFGGTGVDSAGPLHTRDFPHRLEAGTLNLVGIMGLCAGVDYIQRIGIDAIHRQEAALLERLVQGLAGQKNIELYGARNQVDQTAVLSTNIKGVHAADVGAILDADFNIAVRAGLHCAPLAHQQLGTLERGAVRFSIGLFNTQAHIDRAVEAMTAIAGHSR
jgi:cysteine desulfurase/selenocysteine lyase